MTAQQKHTIAGALGDTGRTANFQNAIVLLSRANDSILVAFARADINGKFKLTNIPAGNYLIEISYPKYVAFSDNIYLQTDTLLPFIQMLSEAVVLQNVVVRGSPVRMKGDTLSFAADSFKVREGDNVEALLKRLPGLQVNAKGEITAMGQKVQKVLVDGDEFFGDDPTLATRNIRADMVKEVQVFDKKSDQATFTGVDDGTANKTINLKLKDEAKKGYFGKVSIGGGTPDHWKNDAMLNRFKNKQKIAAYGLMSNVDKAGLDWSDETNYGGGMDRQTEVSEDGGISVYSQGDDFDRGGNASNEALPKAWTGGTHFSNKWNNDKQNLNGSYRFRKLIAAGGTRTTTQFLLPDTQYTNNENSRFLTSKLKHKANASYEIKIDSLNSLIIKANGGYGTTNTVGNFTSEALADNGLAVNKSQRKTTNDATNNQFNSSLLWRKKFAKKGRTLSLNLSQNSQTGNSTGFLYNENTFFTNGQPSSKDSTDQQKTSKTDLEEYSGKVAYTEGFGKKGIIEFNYQFTQLLNESKRLSFDKINGKYDVLNNQFSNHFDFKSNTHATGMGIRWNGKVVTLGASAGISAANWKQNNILKDTLSHFSFTNFITRANLNWKIAQQTNFRFDYSGSTRTPSITQLQPVADNNNPLNIVIGNPNLNLAFNHNFNISFNDYKVISGRGIFGYANFTMVDNDFSNRSFVDEKGRLVSQTVNVQGNYNFFSNLYYNRNIGKKDWSINAELGVNGGKYINIVNDNKNKTINRNYTAQVGMSKNSEKGINAGFILDATYATSKSSIRKDARTQYWMMEPEVYFNLDISKKWRFSTDVEYQWRQKTSVFDQNNNAVLWNAIMSTKLLKKKDVRLEASINDILNQKIGFNRQINSNFTSERNWNVVRRYWLLTLRWNFSKNGKPSEW